MYLYLWCVNSWVWVWTGGHLHKQKTYIQHPRHAEHRTLGFGLEVKQTKKEEQKRKRKNEKKGSFYVRRCSWLPPPNNHQQGNCTRQTNGVPGALAGVVAGAAGYPRRLRVVIRRAGGEGHRRRGTGGMIRGWGGGLGFDICLCQGFCFDLCGCEWL